MMPLLTLCCPHCAAETLYNTVLSSQTVRHLILLAAQAAADHVGLQLGPSAELHRLVIPGQSGLPLPVHHQHELDHRLTRDVQTSRSQVPRSLVRLHYGNRQTFWFLFCFC